MSPYPFSPKKSYRTTGLIASKRSDRNANGRRARKSTERKEDATFGDCFSDHLLFSDISRKKSQAGQQSKGLNSYPSPEQTSHSELPPITHMESQHLTSSRLASTPHKNVNNLMELSLSTSTNNSRPRTPQDFSFTTTQHSNCRQLQHLTALIKSHANDVEKYRILTNALIYKGYYEEDPFLIETIQRFENSSMKHQQAEGIKTDETKVQAIVEMKPPRNSKEVSKYLGMSQWYAKFIKNYANLCEPLYNLKRKLKRFIYIWSIEAQKTFDVVKAAKTKAPVLKFLDFKKPFELFTDASSLGVGVVLNQEQRPVVFASRTLSATERNYTVITDHAASTHLTTGKILSNGMIRWALKLAEFNIEWEHHPGTQNTIADV
ncbi:retrovirus-related Pol polyprotein from transposon opus [Trichonephila clavipes]|nr:retrovirus-related Pol polyprotein from transposon opus [Trichonephila clavipes]